MSLSTLQARPTVTRYLPSIQGATSNTVILAVSLFDAPSIKLHHCITTCAVLPRFHQYITKNGYVIFQSMPLSSKVVWLLLNPRWSTTNTIYPRHTDMSPSNITSYSLMSNTSLPPTHPNPLPTSPVDQTTVLFNSTTQQMHQNIAIMAQLQRQASPTVTKTPVS